MTAQTAFRLIHILGGICWVGGVVFVTMFLLPAARAVGPAAGPVIREINGARKLPVYLAAMSWLTMLSGAVLAWRDAGPLGMRWFEHGMGLVLAIGATIAIAAAVVGMTVSAPAAKKMAAISREVQRAGREPSESEAKEIKGLQDRLFKASRVLATMLLLASAAMASARYM
jgi:uncharacterized membrane protein